MGRGRKPLAMQNGNLTVVQQVAKQQEEDMITLGREQLDKAPAWLVDETAKREFKRIVKEFKSIDMVGNLDLNNIGSYCNAFSLYLRATKELKGQPLTIEKCLPNGSKTIAENPLIKIQKNYADEMRRFSALCGMTIDSRLKYATVKISKDEQEITGEFGII